MFEWNCLILLRQIHVLNIDIPSIGLSNCLPQSHCIRKGVLESGNYIVSVLVSDVLILRR